MGNPHDTNLYTIYKYYNRYWLKSGRYHRNNCISAKHKFKITCAPLPLKP